MLSKPLCLLMYIVGITVESTAEDKVLKHNNTSLSGEGCITQQKHVSPVIKKGSVGNVKFAVPDSAEK